MLDGIGVLALVLIASFAVDRIVSGILYFVPFARPKPGEPPTMVQRIIYFTLAGIVGGGVLAYWGEIRIFHALGFTTIKDLLDTVLTGLIFMAGADCVGAFFRRRAAAGVQPAGKPVRITGTLMVDDEQGKSAKSGA